MKYHIYRLTDTMESDELRFMGSDWLNQHQAWPPQPDDYERIWTGTINEQETAEILEAIYLVFNLHHPKDFHHYSLSIGDIVVLEGDERTTHFCDRTGWTEIPNFPTE